MSRSTRSPKNKDKEPAQAAPEKKDAATASGQGGTSAPRRRSSARKAPAKAAPDAPTISADVSRPDQKAAVANQLEADRKPNGGQENIPPAPSEFSEKRPMNIKYPQSFEEAGAIVVQASDDLLSIVPAGHLTRLKNSRAVSRAVSVVLSTKNLKSVISIEPDNLLAIVEAGMTPDEVEEALKPTGLYWPVTGQGRRTLGAIMAEGALGAETMARGSMLDWVLGTSFITAEGKLVESGGRTLKNVTGYDYTRLAWRSFGRLGVCVRFILKLLPRPVMNPVLAVKMENPAVAANVAREIILSKMGPEALRIDYSREGAYLLVWLTGFPEVVEAKKKQIASMAGSKEITVHEDGFAFWSKRSKIWDMGDPAIHGFMGPRKAVLETSAKLSSGAIAGILGADIDVGGGRVYLKLEDGVDPEGTARTVGLTPDCFTNAGLVYQRLKKGLDPKDVFFPDKLLD